MSIINRGLQFLHDNTPVRVIVIVFDYLQVFDLSNEFDELALLEYVVVTIVV